MLDRDLILDCAWRLCRSGRIEVAYRDYYDSPEDDPIDDWDELVVC